MQIIRQTDGISVEKKDGTRVIYHIFSEFEIHYNNIPPLTQQDWHRHEVIEEVLFLISGKLEVVWNEKEKIKKEFVNTGDIIRVEKSLHSINNPTLQEATFLVLRFVPDGKDKRSIIKSDKHSS